MKNFIWFLILLFIVIIAVFYNLMLKASIKDFQVFDFLKHPDKVPMRILDGGENHSVANFFNKINPFKNNDEPKDEKEEAEVSPDTNENFQNNQSEDIILLSSEEGLPEQIETLQDNGEVLKNNHIDKKNIFIDSYKLSLFRHFLSNMQLLIINFAQDKNYQDSLDKIKFFINNVPELCDIIPVITMFETYSDKYLVSNPEYKESILPEYGAIKRFIKIEKDSPAFIEKQELKNKIYLHLNNLINIIYSNKTEQLFLNSGL